MQFGRDQGQPARYVHRVFDEVVTEDDDEWEWTNNVVYTTPGVSSPGFCRGWLSGVDEVVDGLWCRFDRRVLCFVLRRWDVADLAVNPAVVEPVDVLGDGDLEVVDSSPRSLVEYSLF